MLSYFIFVFLHCYSLHISLKFVKVCSSIQNYSGLQPFISFEILVLVLNLPSRNCVKKCFLEMRLLHWGSEKPEFLLQSILLYFITVYSRYFATWQTTNKRNLLEEVHLVSQFLNSPMISLYSTFSLVIPCSCFAFTFNSTLKNILLSIYITSLGIVCVLLALVSGLSDSTVPWVSHGGGNDDDNIWHLFITRYPSKWLTNFNLIFTIH